MGNGSWISRRLVGRRSSRINEEKKRGIQVSTGLAMWDVQYTTAPPEGRNYRQNKRLSVIAVGIERAIELVKASGNDVQISQILKRSSSEMIIDT